MPFISSLRSNSLLMETKNIETSKQSINIISIPSASHVPK